MEHVDRSQTAEDLNNLLSKRKSLGIMFGFIIESSLYSSSFCFLFLQQQQQFKTETTTVARVIRAKLAMRVTCNKNSLSTVVITSQLHSFGEAVSCVGGALFFKHFAGKVPLTWNSFCQTKNSSSNVIDSITFPPHSSSSTDVRFRPFSIWKKEI